MLLVLRAGALEAAETGTPRLDVSSRLLDFGSPGHRQVLTRTLALRNTGGAALQVTGLRSSCDCAKVALSSPTIPPGEAAELTVTLSTGRLMGLLNKVVQFQTNDPRAAAVRLPLLARVHDNVRAEPWTLAQFDAVAQGPPIRQEFTLRWIKPPGGGLVLEDLKGDREGLTAEASPITTGGVVTGWKVTVQATPGATEGIYSGNLTAKLNGAPWVFPVQGYVFKGILVKPRYFQFGRIDDPRAAASTSELSSADGRPFEILGITVTPPILTITTTTTGDGTGHTLTARIAQADPSQRFFARVAVRTSHPDKPLIELPVLGFWPVAGAELPLPPPPPRS